MKQEHVIISHAGRDIAVVSLSPIAGEFFDLHLSSGPTSCYLHFLVEYDWVDVAGFREAIRAALGLLVFRGGL